MDIINTNLSINTERISNTKYKVTIQSFPQKNKDIVNYKLVFDMKFRDDYENDFAGVCIGPAWENYGPGEFTLNLNVSNNFKNFIIAENKLVDDDGCQNYFYYLRYLEITTEQQNKYLVANIGFTQPRTSPPKIGNTRNENRLFKNAGTPYCRFQKIAPRVRKLF